MKLGWIGPEALPVFRPLLLAPAAGALERGEPVTALGITEGDLACGAAAGYLDDGRFQLVSLYVAPGYRRRGGGRMLLQGLFSLLRGLPGAGGVSVSYTATEPDHALLAPFLAAMGFSPEEDRGENLFFASLSDAAASPFFSGRRAPAAGVLPFSRIPDIYLSLADRRARLQDAPMPEAPLDGPAPDRDVSTALVRDGAVGAFVVFDTSCCGRLTLSCAWSGSEGPTALPALLRESFRLALEKYPADTPIALQAVTPAAAQLVRALLPGAQPISFTYYRPLGDLLD